MKYRYLRKVISHILNSVTGSLALLKQFSQNLWETVLKIFWLKTMYSMQKNTICDALRDLVPFAQFKKCEKHPWRSVNFRKCINVIRSFQSQSFLNIAICLLTITEFSEQKSNNKNEQNFDCTYLYQQYHPLLHICQGYMRLLGDHDE